MKRLIYLLLLTRAWGQVGAAPPPTVQDTYVQNGEHEPVIREVRLKDTLTVVVCKADYDAWASQQTGKLRLALFLNGKVLRGLDKDVVAPQSGPPDDETKDRDTKRVNEACGSAAAARDVLTYYIDPQFAANADTKEQWLRVLERPWEGRSFEVSVGLEDGSPWPSNARIRFKRINGWWLTGWIALFAAAIVLFVRYARTSDIIRDAGPDLAAAAPGEPAPMKSYSLARTQMAIWTFLVAGALAFIFLVTWNENTLSNGVLVLIGISFSTTLLASAADGPPAAQPTQGFVRDLLSDGTGPSFHRYQMVLFTVILAVIFVVKTVSGLVIPEFDPTLLGLMGISSGTYLGFKLKE